MPTERAHPRDGQDAPRPAAAGRPDRARDGNPAALRPAVDPEQQRVFQPGAKRRIVIATNVAESSLTVPRIRFVIDPGTARISRYSPRSKTQRLPIEAVSRASADQRKGRCGRVGPGICLRLFSEQDYLARDRLHDAGNPADQPGRRDPADEGPAAGRIERFPVPRSAQARGRPRRLPHALRARRDRRATAS